MLGFSFWSFSSNVASGTPKRVLSEEDQSVRWTFVQRNFFPQCCFGEEMLYWLWIKYCLLCNYVQNTCFIILQSKILKDIYHGLIHTKEYVTIVFQWWAANNTAAYLGFSSCPFCSFWPPALGGHTAPSCRWEPTDAPSSCRCGRDPEYESLLDGTCGIPPAEEVRVEGEESEKRRESKKMEVKRETEDMRKKDQNRDILIVMYCKSVPLYAVFSIRCELNVSVHN